MDVRLEDKDLTLKHLLERTAEARQAGVTLIAFSVVDVCEALGFETREEKEAAYLVLEGHYGFAREGRVHFFSQAHRDRYEEIFVFYVSPSLHEGCPYRQEKVMTNPPNWANRTVWTGDNLDILRGMNSETVDLIYLDPPFNSNKDYAAPVGSEAAGAAFKDTWSLSDLDVAWMGLIADEEPAIAHLLDTTGQTHSKGMQSYLTMMAVRLLEMRRVLKDTGSIYLHCDPTAGHYLKLLMDAVFGQDSFRSDISWKRTSAHSDTRQGRNQHGRVHDALLFYSRSERWTWNPIYTDYGEEYVRSFYRHIEPETGRRYQLGDLTGPGGAAKGNPEYEVMGVTRYWRYSQERMEQLIAEGRIVQSSPGAVPRYKRYVDEMPGVPLQDVWTDLPRLALGRRNASATPHRSRWRSSAASLRPAATPAT